jgi:hypothetical protein
VTAITASALLRAARRRHADPDALVETGMQEGVPVIQLLLLIERLRDSNPRWRLPKRLRDPLIDALLDAGKPASTIATRIGCSRPTVAKRAEAIAATSRPTPTDGLNKPSNCQVSGTCGCPSILSFFSHSGADMTADATREFLARLGGEK